MRLFVSINLGEELNEYLAGAQGELEKAAGKNVRLSLAGRKSGFHLTLFFLGDVEVEKVLGLQRELRAIPFESFKLKFKKRLGVFKGGGGCGVGSRADGGFIKAVFVDIDSGCEGFTQLLNLQKKVAEVVGKFGLGGGGESGGGRPFSPHITLARVGFCPADRAAEFEKAVLSLEVSQQEFDVSSFYLMESELGAGGSKYSEVRRLAKRIKYGIIII